MTNKALNQKWVEVQKKEKRKRIKISHQFQNLVAQVRTQSNILWMTLRSCRHLNWATKFSPMIRDSKTAICLKSMKLETTNWMKLYQGWNAWKGMKITRSLSFRSFSLRSVEWTILLIKVINSCFASTTSLRRSFMTPPKQRENY